MEGRRIAPDESRPTSDRGKDGSTLTSDPEAPPKALEAPLEIFKRSDNPVKFTFFEKFFDRSN